MSSRAEDVEDRERMAERRDVTARVAPPRVGSGLMRRHLSLLLVLAVAFASAGALAACGTKTVTDTGANGQTTVKTVPNVHFAKTKFLLHTGLAFGAFHRYIYKPFKSGGFKGGAPGQKAAIAKAAATALFVYHELKQADDAAQSSDILRTKVAEPLAAALAKVKDLPALLKGGSFGAIGGVSKLFDTLKTAAGAAGANISDK
jgi:hypothetical protein